MASGAGGVAPTAGVVAPVGRRGCCCGGGCCDCPKDFQKVLELKDVGLVVYRHTARTEERNKITGLLESTIKTTDDVFILLNTKSSALKSAEYLPGIESTTTSCPRCRLLADQVHGLLQRAPNIDTKDVSGICTRCLMRDKSCRNCERILDKFMSNRRGVSEGTKASIRQWLSKIRHILDEITGVEHRDGRERYDSGKIRASSELDIDRVFMRSRKDSRQLDIIPLFRPRAVRIDERGQFVDDTSRMFDIFGETTTSRRHEFEHDLDGRPRRWQEDVPTTSRAATATATAGLWTRRSFSEESIPFTKVSKGDPGRRGHDYGELHRFQEGEYEKRSEGRDFIEADDFTRQRYRDHREVHETYARGDAHHKDLKTVRSRSLAPTRKGTRVDTSEAGELAQSDDRIHDKIESKWKAKDPSKREAVEHDYKEKSKKDIEEQKQKQREKDETGKTKTDKSKLVQDQQKLKTEKDKSAKDKSGQEQKQKGEKELTTKDKGIKEQKQNGDKEFSAKDKGGQEPKQKGEKELTTKDKGIKEQKQKGDKELSAKDRGDQEPKQKGEKELTTKDKGIKEHKQKGDKELSAKDKGGQVPKLKGKKEITTKDISAQELKQKEKEKHEKEISTKDKSRQEGKQKGEKELSTKDKTTQVPTLKGDKEISTKDKSGQELQQKGERELSIKDKGGQEQVPREEKELGTKEKDGQEPKQKGEKELSTKDKTDQRQNQEEEKKIITKDKGSQEQKSKVEKEIGTRDKDRPGPKQKGEKALSTKDKSGQEQKQKGEKELDSKVKEGIDKKNEDEKVRDTKKTGKEEKHKDDKEPQQDEKSSKDKEKKEKRDTITIIMEQRRKDRTFKEDTGPRVRQRGIKDEGEEEDNKTGKRGKGRKPDKKQDESKEKLQSKKKESVAGEKDLPINKIRMRRASPDDLILQLVQLKKTVGAGMPQRPDIEIGLKHINRMIRKHFDHKHAREQFVDVCPFCADSDYGLDTLELLLQPHEPDMAEVIIGTKVYKYRPPLSPSIMHPDEHPLEAQRPRVPLHFHSTYQAENIVQLLPPKEEAPPSPPPPPVEEKKDDPKLSKKKAKQSQPTPETETISPKGIMNYKLSDRSFIEKGWTKLPTEKVVRKLNVYRMRPARPEFDWFEHNKRKRYMTYESGERLAEFDDDGRGRWYYRNGRLALDYYDAEGLNAQQRFVVWSSGEADERGRARPYTVLATFDYLGNGTVFDHGGKIRLKYNQTEGIVLDRSIGPVSHWKWHSLNDPPVLAQVMIDTQEPHGDPRLAELGAGAGATDDRPPRPDNDEMLAIEFDNFVRAKGEKLTRAFEPYQIKMKALKINEYFSLKVLDQATVYLIYRDGRTNLKLNLGMVLDHHEIVDTEHADVGEVTAETERRPARSASMAALAAGVAAARRAAAHEARRHPPPPAPASVDRLTAAATCRPPPLVPLAASDACRCSRKPLGPNLYYDNRIF